VIFWTTAFGANCDFEALPLAQSVQGQAGQNLPTEALLKLGRMQPGPVRTILVELPKTAEIDARNSDRIVRASITYAELLGKWNSALDSQKAATVVAEEVRANGIVVGLALPLATLFDMTRLLGRRDFAAVAGVGISYINPSAARQLCQSIPFSVETITKPAIQVPVSLTGNALFAFSIKRQLETAPALATPSPRTGVTSSQEALYGDSSAWKQSAGGQQEQGASRTMSRFDCHMACLDQAFEASTRTLFKDASDLRQLERRLSAAERADQPILVHEAIIDQVRDAVRHSDTVYKETYRDCAKDKNCEPKTDQQPKKKEDGKTPSTAPSNDQKDVKVNPTEGKPKKDDKSGTTRGAGQSGKTMLDRPQNPDGPPPQQVDALPDACKKGPGSYECIRWCEQTNRRAPICGGNVAAAITRMCVASNCSEGASSRLRSVGTPRDVTMDDRGAQYRLAAAHLDAQVRLNPESLVNLSQHDKQRLRIILSKPEVSGALSNDARDIVQRSLK